LQPNSVKEPLINPERTDPTQAPTGVVRPVAIFLFFIAGCFVLGMAGLQLQSAQTDLGLLCLDVSLIWVVVFTGMMISSARHEMNMREEVSWLASHDPLTGLENRHVFMERLEATLQRVGEEANHLLVFLDMDRFKDLNDAEGIGQVIRCCAKSVHCWAGKSARQTRWRAWVVMSLR